MSGGAAIRSGMSPAEYLAFERAADEKHELFAGEVFAMSGGTRQHSLIATNVAAELRAALPCEVHGSDMRVKVEAAQSYAYPDASVVGGERRFEDERRETLLNPILIVEVLSESIEAHDGGKKFEHYRQIDSLAEYVLVSQRERHIEQFVRQADGTWNLREARAGGRLELPSLGCALAVDEVYLKVFDDAAAAGA